MPSSTEPKLKVRSIELPCGLVWLFRVVFFVLAVKVFVASLLVYFDYFPANLRSDFLVLHRAEFHGWYAAAFYTHILTSPLAILNGFVLVLDAFRNRFLKWHRRLGKVQVLLILVFVAPSGIAMAQHSTGGVASQISFSILGVALAMSVVLGWRFAAQGKMRMHQLWMHRCTALLCSALVIRVVSPMLGYTSLEPVLAYQISSWLSWLLPLAAVELLWRFPQRGLNQLVAENQNPNSFL